MFNVHCLHQLPYHVSSEICIHVFYLKLDSLSNRDPQWDRFLKDSRAQWNVSLKQGIQLYIATLKRGQPPGTITTQWQIPWRYFLHIYLQSPAKGREATVGSKNLPTRTNGAQSKPHVLTQLSSKTCLPSKTPHETLTEHSHSERLLITFHPHYMYVSLPLKKWAKKQYCTHEK